MRRHSEDYEAVAVGLGKESFDAFVSEDVEVMQHGQNGRLGGAMAGQHGVLRLDLKA